MLFAAIDIHKHVWVPETRVSLMSDPAWSSGPAGAVAGRQADGR